MARKAEDKQAAANDGGSSAAALIVAHNQARYIAATVRAATAIPGIDLVLVVDDASTDNTQELARKAQVTVVRNRLATRAELAGVLQDASCLLLVRERTRLGAAQLSLAPALRLISQTGATFAHLDLDEINRRRQQPSR